MCVQGEPLQDGRERQAGTASRRCVLGSARVYWSAGAAVTNTKEGVA